MIFERIKSEGLAHYSYFIGSGNSAVIIDPRRDSQIYLDLALQHGLKIKYILETHRNEDYVIGSIELSRTTGAVIYHGPWLEWEYGTSLKDGQDLRFGKLNIKALHTPGHTDESVSYVLFDPDAGDSPVMVFTGDTLFAGSTGRVDLYGLSEIPRMASNLYDSLFNKILPLGDGVILCPAHGAGSICGSDIVDRDESTLGIERMQNPVLQLATKDEFVEYKTTEYHEKPPYFAMMEKYNLEGPTQLSGLPAPPVLIPKEFENEIEKGAVVVDTRWPSGFGGVHIRGSYSIWLAGLPSWAGWVLPYDKSLLLVLEDPSHLDQAVRYLYRVGFHQIVGFLYGGIESWYNSGFPVEHLKLLSVQELKGKLDQGESLAVLDVRNRTEWKSGHIEGAMHIFVGQLEKRLSEVPRDRPIAVVCNVGQRAGLASSILLRAGFTDVSNVLGSITAWRHAGFPLVSE